MAALSRLSIIFSDGDIHYRSYYDLFKEAYLLMASDYDLDVLKVSKGCLVITFE